MIRPHPFLRALALTVGFAFLYLPILCLMVFSFNDSSMMTSWTGFSLKWYVELFKDQALLDAARLSLLIAALTATAAVVIGTWAAYVLARMGRFRGVSLYIGMVSAPLVVPEVVLGISLLLMFVEVGDMLGWPAGNGVFTIWVGHVTLCMAYVAVIIQARIRDLDRSLEEAALDLGATPLKVFFVVTLPLIFPALLAAWLLAFTLSLDDVVIASFLSGPGYTTLPLEVFSRVRLGLKPEINALATLFILVVGLFVVVANRVQWRRQAQ
ncbi:putrescine ABC transporter, permease protein [Pusillimonas sp. T7-7]|uniref:ABC transporter permease subunit n=1 Tax=Pusillimonas sp. (strain T7-7) TaxID=1007105 RepID=UPI000208528C|nr:ABC transporter permease subunit [Pusillimonas sp. T7-7]AEC19029.1 putrescine ABC transporter, permease protein [Pusillimonas sp. T7-7]